MNVELEKRLPHSKSFCFEARCVRQKHHTRYDLRKYYFHNRVVSLWNSLPNRVVMSDSTNIFKRERERFYSQEAGIQKGHAHQTWCLLFSNISMIFYTNNNETKKSKRGEVQHLIYNNTIVWKVQHNE